MELIKQLKKTIRELESHSKREIAKIYIGKTFIPHRKNPPRPIKRYATFDPLKPCTWRKTGISDRWKSHKHSAYGRDGLVVLGAITKQTVPKEIRRRVHREDFALAMEQILLHYFRLYQPDSRVENKTFTAGSAPQNKYPAYAIYMTFRYKDTPTTSDQDDKVASDHHADSNRPEEVSSSLATSGRQNNHHSQRKDLQQSSSVNQGFTPVPVSHPPPSCHPPASPSFKPKEHFTCNPSHPCITDTDHQSASCSQIGSTSPDSKLKVKSLPGTSHQRTPYIGSSIGHLAPPSLAGSTQSSSPDSPRIIKGKTESQPSFNNQCTSHQHTLGSSSCQSASFLRASIPSSSLPLPTSPPHKPMQKESHCNLNPHKSNSFSPTRKRKLSEHQEGIQLSLPEDETASVPIPAEKRKKMTPF